MATAPLIGPNDPLPNPRKGSTIRILGESHYGQAVPRLEDPWYGHTLGQSQQNSAASIRTKVMEANDTSSSTKDIGWRATNNTTCHFLDVNGNSVFSSDLRAFLGGSMTAKLRENHIAGVQVEMEYEAVSLRERATQSSRKPGAAARG